MKRILAWILTALLVLALAACGEKVQPELPSSLSSADPSQSAPAADGTTDTSAAKTPLPSDTTVTEAAGISTDTPADTTAPAEATRSTEAVTDAAATTETTTETTAETTAAASSAATAETTHKAPETTAPAAPEGGKALILYFSCTGTTRDAAERIAALTGGELHEIVPEEPYSAADINYNNDDCRANREMNAPAARPAIAGDALDLAGYDTVFIGYPIWWGTMPKIINTLLDTYDFAGKVVLPFCTSGSSGIATSVAAIRDAEPDADVRDGLRVTSTDRTLTDWLDNNRISQKEN